MIHALTLRQAEHIAHHAREAERREMTDGGWGDYEPQEHARWACSQTGPSYCCADRTGEPVVMGGLILLRPGVARSWMTGTDRWPYVVREVTRYCRKVMAAILEADIHRIETVSASWHEEAHRWYRLLELERESIMVGYGADGSDFFMFRRIRDVLGR